MKEDKFKLIFAAIVIGMLLFFSFLNEKSKNTDVPAAKKEWMLKGDISERTKIHAEGREETAMLRNLPEDNINLPKESRQLQFFGYEENKQAFSWLQEEDWTRFQSQAERYLYKKGFHDVTKVTLHADSIQFVNAYETNMYFDIDYQTETAETLTMKAVCDTYKDVMRFSFEIQYGK